MEYNSLQAWLLGDSGYACKPWLLTPIPIPQTPQEVRYNAAHKTTRCIVERCIGVLKSRFRWVFIKLNPFLSESNLCIQLYRCHSIQIKKKLEKCVQQSLKSIDCDLQDILLWIIISVKRRKSSISDELRCGTVSAMAGLKEA